MEVIIPAPPSCCGSSPTRTPGCREAPVHTSPVGRLPAPPSWRCGGFTRCTVWAYRGQVSRFAFAPGTLSEPARTKPHVAGMRWHQGLERKPQQQVTHFTQRIGGGGETAQSCWVAENSDLKCPSSILKSCFLKHFSKGVFSIEEQIGIFLVLEKPQDEEDTEEEEEEEVTGRVDAAKKNSEELFLLKSRAKNYTFIYS